MNINHYINAKKEIQKLFLKQKDKEILWSISMISVCTHVPVIACTFYIGELLGWPEEILDSIKRLTKNYSYRNIEGIPESYPKERM